MWTIERLDGVSFRGSVIAARVDSISFVEEHTGQAGTVPIRNIATISSSPGVVEPILGLLGGGAGRNPDVLSEQRESEDLSRSIWLGAIASSITFS
jgi:hypothetical protein